MSAGAVESFAKLAGALAALASFKIGGSGRIDRVRQRFARAAVPGARKRRDLDDGAFPVRGRTRDSRRRRVSVSRVLLTIWLVLLVFIVGYVTVRGPSALSDLDEAKVITDF